LKEFWDDRYAEEGYAYGEEPNVFFKQEIDKLPIGKLLMPAEGEGRNAVYAATLGWDVYAFDISEEGKKKADELAQKNGVTINYIVSDFDAIPYENESFDAVGLIYAHFTPDLRSDYHQKLISLLKHGGSLILEGFSKEHLHYNQKNPKVGGPRDIAMLYSLEELSSDFDHLEIHTQNETLTALDEGKYHVGQGSVVQLVGVKR
jgi:SAM-dependent methyltransferase